MPYYKLSCPEIFQAETYQAAELFSKVSLLCSILNTQRTVSIICSDSILTVSLFISLWKTNVFVLSATKNELHECIWHCYTIKILRTTKLTFQIRLLWKILLVKQYKFPCNLTKCFVISCLLIFLLNEESSHKEEKNATNL